MTQLPYISDINDILNDRINIDLICTKNIEKLFASNFYSDAITIIYNKPQFRQKLHMIVSHMIILIKRTKSILLYIIRENIPQDRYDNSHSMKLCDCNSYINLLCDILYHLQYFGFGYWN